MMCLITNQMGTVTKFELVATVTCYGSKDSGRSIIKTMIKKMMKYKTAIK